MLIDSDFGLLAPAVFEGPHPQQGLKPASFEGILARLKSGPVTRLPPERAFCSLHNTQDFWWTTLEAVPTYPDGETATVTGRVASTGRTSSERQM
jgi:hypothetical protein